MKIRWLHLGRLLTDRLIVGAGKITGAKRLPVYFNRRLLFIDKEFWKTAHVVYETETAKIFDSLLTPGNVFYDVGAHIGFWTLYAQKLVGPSGRTYSFEPSEAFRCLKVNAALFPNIECINAAIGSADGETVFYNMGVSYNGSLIAGATARHQSYWPDTPIEQRKVSVRALDSFLAQDLRPPDVIKVDVEGFEVEVLKGARRLVEKCRPRWIIEVHPKDIAMTGADEKDVVRLLEQYGYFVEARPRQDNGTYLVLASPKGDIASR